MEPEVGKLTWKGKKRKKKKKKRKYIKGNDLHSSLPNLPGGASAPDPFQVAVVQLCAQEPAAALLRSQSLFSEAGDDDHLLQPHCLPPRTASAQRALGTWLRPKPQREQC